MDWSHAYDEPHGGGIERKTWKDADVMVRVVRVYHQWCPQLPLLTSPEGVEEGWGGLQMMLDQSTSSLVGLLLWLNTALGFSRTSISAGSSQSQTLTLLTPRPWLLSLPQIKNAKVKKCQTLPHRFLFHMSVQVIQTFWWLYFSMDADKLTSWIAIYGLSWRNGRGCSKTNIHAHISRN